MHKVLVFDLDGTLAPIGRGMLPGSREKLQKLEKMGYQIVICSGKSVDYLCGFARQLDLNRPVIIGENGAVIQIGAGYPPESVTFMPCSRKAREQIILLQQILREQLGDELFIQPNQVVLNPFPRNEEVFDRMMEIIEEHIADTTELRIHRHIDCLDLLPKEINKQNALKRLSEMLCIPSSEFLAVGDGPNDLSMFEFADISIGVGPAVREAADYYYEDIREVLDFLINESV